MRLVADHLGKTIMRLLVHVEGQTEETFINRVIAPHLYCRGYHQVAARLFGNARLRQQRGGIRSWQSVRTDILRHLKENNSVIVTTMVDYYAMPRTGDKAWPGRDRAARELFPNKAITVEEELHTDIVHAMGDDFVPRRFIPFVVMHEFEGLLFSDCRAFSQAIARPELQEPLQAIRQQFSSPEEINDSPHTAPSKRILKLFPEYQKPLMGELAAQGIGLATMRQECPHFDQWLKCLEQYHN